MLLLLSTQEGIHTQTGLPARTGCHLVPLLLPKFGACYLRNSQMSQTWREKLSLCQSLDVAKCYPIQPSTLVILVTSGESPCSSQANNLKITPNICLTCVINPFHPTLLTPTFLHPYNGLLLPGRLWHSVLICIFPCFFLGSFTSPHVPLILHCCILYFLIN